MFMTNQVHNRAFSKQNYVLNRPHSVIRRSQHTFRAEGIHYEHISYSHSIQTRSLQIITTDDVQNRFITDPFITDPIITDLIQKRPVH